MLAIEGENLNGVSNPDREYQRFRIQRKVFLLKGTGLQNLKPSQLRVAGKTRNISDGGICLIMNTHARVSQFLRLGIQIESLPVYVPVIVEVRWIQKIEPRRFKLGVRFVF